MRAWCLISLLLSLSSIQGARLSSRASQKLTQTDDDAAWPAWRQLLQGPPDEATPQFRPGASSAGFRCLRQRVECLALLCVHVSHQDFQSRQLHRNTYMKHLPPGIDAVFVLELPKQSSHAYTEILRAENELHKDMFIVPYRQTGDPDVDGGRSRPFKTIAFLAWAAATNAVAGYHYIAKLDTDTVINPWALRTVISKLPHTRTVFCRRVSQEIRSCGGPFYMFSADVGEAIAVDKKPPVEAVSGTHHQPEDLYFDKMIRMYIEDKDIIDAGNDICDPLEPHTPWSAEVTNTTVAIHQVKTTEAYVKFWSQLWPYIRTTEHMHNSGR